MAQDVCSLVRAKQSSPFLVVMSLLGIDERTLSSFWSTPSVPSLNFPSPLEPSRITAAAPLRGESGRMADWTSNTGYEPKIGLNPNTELTTIYNQVDNYQEKASLSSSDQVRKKDHKAVAANLQLARYRQWSGSWKRERDCISQVCFLIQQDPRNWSQNLWPRLMSRCWQTKKKYKVKQSNLNKIKDFWIRFDNMNQQNTT